MSAPSTPCTPPPGHWPSAATRCSRSRSRRCAGSVSAPGGSARSSPPPSSCSTTSTAAPHDQQAREAVTGNGSVPHRGLSFVQERRRTTRSPVNDGRGQPSIPLTGAHLAHEFGEIAWAALIAPWGSTAADGLASGWPFPRDEAGFASSCRTPVVLVHGYGGSRATWLPVEREAQA